VTDLTALVEKLIAENKNLKAKLPEAVSPL
jgi:hypothetical protein